MLTRGPPGIAGRRDSPHPAPLRRQFPDSLKVPPSVLAVASFDPSSLAGGSVASFSSLRRRSSSDALLPVPSPFAADAPEEADDDAFEDFDEEDFDYEFDDDFEEEYEDEYEFGEDADPPESDDDDDGEIDPDLDEFDDEGGSTEEPSDELEPSEDSGD